MAKSRIALLALVALTAIADPAAAARTPRPASVVYVSKYRGSYRIRRQAVARGGTWWLTRDKTAPTGLQCTANGSWVVYVRDGHVWARSLARRGKPLKIGTLPRTIWELHRNRVRSFVRLSPSGRYVALPDRHGVYVYDLQTRKSLLVKPPTPGGEGGRKVRVVHPARWFPDRDVLLYLTQRGERGPGVVNARVFDLIQGRHTLWFPVLTRAVDGVLAFDAVFSHDGARLALSLHVKKGRRRKEQRKIFSINPYKELRLPRRLVVGRIHGFDPRLGDVVLTGRLGRRSARLWSYSFTRKRRRLLDIGFLSSARMVLGFYPERRTALVAAPYRGGKCAGRTKLFKASVRFPMKSLARWAKWAEIVASDPTGSWMVFRLGSTCTHRRPTLYLMMADGWGLMRDMPSRYAPLRKVAPQDAALCPATPRRRRRRRRR